MSSTERLYLADMRTLSAAATVVALRDTERGLALVLDRTPFYPQGGGQPGDIGAIVSTAGAGARFRVDSTRVGDNDEVLHFGALESGALAPGDAVRAEVGADRRLLHNRLHSAGHLVDMAVAELGLGWVPGKGYHFPQGPYVEYGGSVAAEKREELRAGIEQRANRLGAATIAVEVRSLTAAELPAIMNPVPDWVPREGPVRVVLFGSFAVPCGGTHVAALDDIGPVAIRRVKQEGAAVRVSYALAGGGPA